MQGARGAVSLDCLPGLSVQRQPRKLHPNAERSLHGLCACACYFLHRRTNYATVSTSPLRTLLCPYSSSNAGCDRSHGWHAITGLCYRRYTEKKTHFFKRVDKAMYFYDGRLLQSQTHSLVFSTLGIRPGLRNLEGYPARFWEIRTDPDRVPGGSVPNRSRVPGLSYSTSARPFLRFSGLVCSS